MTSWTAAYRKIGYRWLAPIGVLCSITAISGARAQPESRDIAVQLTVEATPQCATPKAVIARVRARAPRVVLSETSDASGDLPQLHIKIRRANERQHVAHVAHVATLAVRWPDGRSAERELSATTCEAALDALALLVAMTLDPSALDAGGDNPSAPDAGGDSPSGPDTNGDNPSALDANARIRERPTPTPTPTPTATRATLGTDHVAVGVHAQLLSGPAPDAMLGFGLHVRWAFHGDGWWAPAVALQLAHANSQAKAPGLGNADFQLDHAQISLCPLGVRLGPLSAHACASGALGRMQASGTRTFSAQTHEMLWASTGLAALLALGINELFDLHASVGMQAPFQRYRFAFRPEVFHRVPQTSLHAQLGLGLRFP